MTKYRIHGTEVCSFAQYFIWEVEADSLEAARVKIKELEGDGELPTTEDSPDNTDEIRCIESQSSDDHPEGIELGIGGETA